VLRQNTGSPVFVFEEYPSTEFTVVGDSRLNLEVRTSFIVYVKLRSQKLFLLLLLFLFLFLWGLCGLSLP
jgi:hypothetical protein